MAQAAATSETLLPQSSSRTAGSFGASTMSRRELLSQIAAVVDPNGDYTNKQIVAALKGLGFEPEDLDGSRDGIYVSDLVPDKNKAKECGEQRAEIFEGLRKARFAQLKEALEDITPKAERRLIKVRTGDGVRQIEPGDVGDVSALEGMGDFEEEQAKIFDKIKAEQQRKANLLVSDFLTEKKRMDEADAKIEANQRRYMEMKKAQADATEQKKKDGEKLRAKIADQVNKTNKARADWEDQTQWDGEHRQLRARSYRVANYGSENIANIQEIAAAKRQKCFDQAVAAEQKLLNEIQAKIDRTEARLEARRIADEQARFEKQQRNQAAYQEMQVRIEAHWQDWAEKKLERHSIAKANHERANQQYKTNCLERSKSVGSTAKKAREKWNANYTKLMGAKSESNANLMAKHEIAAIRTQEQMNLRYKCEQDIHTFHEIKDKTWGELQRRRRREMINHQDAHTQELVIKIAEDKAKHEAKLAGQAETRRRRQNIGGQTLALNERAKAGFLKIKAEPDERKILKVMSDLGFTMPKPPGSQEDEDKD
eukprot:TRINITY_DN34533_c0_g1_i1.p1 TRINITY_DN34533_c0_g1~~TRINITY_DN34533_c0_g1_i1.p1  ORF type:complete len:561 (+),score=152.18 TRINITY_DN34533_c0_g1_i1:63-1685(+)